MGFSLNPKALISENGIFKIAEIIIGFICIILLRNYHLDFGSDSWLDTQSAADRHLVGVIALGSSLIIAIPLLIGYVLFETEVNLLEGLFCVTASSMNVAGGALAIEYYKDQNHENETVKAALGMGSLMILNAILFLIDGIRGSSKR